MLTTALLLASGVAANAATPTDVRSATAASTTVATWDPFGTYSAGDVVVHEGQLYLAIQGYQGWGDPTWIMAGSLWAPVADNEAPSIPSGLKLAGLEGTAASLTWTASADNLGVDHYEVYRNGEMVDTTAAPAYADSGLTPSTMYTYSVKAVDFAGNTSAASTEVSGRTKAVDTVAPTKPMRLTSPEVAVTKMVLEWAESADENGVEYYEVFRDGVSVGTSSSEEFTDFGLRASTDYVYTVKAVDWSGNVSPSSGEFRVRTNDTPTDKVAPSAPTNLKV